MTLPLPPFVPIVTQRLHLRELRESDVGAAYLSWFSTPGAAFIAGGQPQTLATLKAFVAEKTAKPDTVLIGIFDGATDAHIGNIKYEPVDIAAGVAVLGIFVGAPDWQGRGAGREAIQATSTWLHKACGVHQIVLGVVADNARAQKTYAALGFVATTSPHIPNGPNILAMVLDLSEA